MRIQRRSFLASIFAAAAAPVFVRAESLMHIYVPKIIIPNGQLQIFDGSGNLLVLTSLGAMVGGEFMGRSQVVKSGTARKAQFTLPNGITFSRDVETPGYSWGGGGFMMNHDALHVGSPFEASGKILFPEA